MTTRVRVIDRGAKRAQKLLKQPRKELWLGVQDPEASAPHPTGDATIGEVAVWNEFGTDTAPARSFLFDWVDENLERIANQLAADTHRVIYANEREEDALKKRGSVYRREVIDRILYQNVLQGNAPATIRKKGFDLPLMDTETLVDSITYRVK